MTQRQLEVLLAEWQATLRLLDWNITANFVPVKELPDDSLAQCKYVIERKIATIKIRRPNKKADAAQHPRDPEADLVHELLHLHTAAFEPSSWESPKGIAIEQHIDLMSEALLRLKRAGTAKRKR